MKKLPILSSILSILAFFSCKDEPEQIPTYLQIAPFEVNETGGADWQKLQLAFVYVDKEYLGAYSFNKPFPVLAAGKKEINVFPGIYANGILGNPSLYLPFQRFDTEIDLNPAETHIVQPKTKYDPLIKIPWGEEGNFDNSTLSFDDVDGNNNTFVVFDTDNAFSGRSARLQVDTLRFLNTVATQWIPQLPNGGAQEIWLEMHYRCDAPFNLLLESRSQGQANITQNVYLFNRKEQWNKIYIDLRDAVVNARQTDYRLIFRLPLPIDQTTGKATQAKATVQFDNLKIVHF